MPLEHSSPQPTTWDFFLAHSTMDTATAEQLYELLHPTKVFLDSKSLKPGDDWSQVLPDAQSHSLITIVLLSAHTPNAYYQREEIIAAIESARSANSAHLVIPVLLDNLPATKIPYGLRSKHSLHLSQEKSLNSIAAKLKEVLAAHSAKHSEDPSGTSRALKFQQTLLQAIARFSHDDLISEVIVPLLYVVHPGKIDLVNLPLTGTRAIASTGVDQINRTHTLCVQVKEFASNVSTNSFEAAFSGLREARLHGISKDSGQEIIVNEAWLITTSSYSLEPSLGVSEVLHDLSKQNIQFISAQELVNLLVDKVPNTATKLAKYSSPEIIRLISLLSKHTEGRAFGFASDRNITEFYVTAALSPYATRAYAAIRGHVSVSDVSFEEDFRVGEILQISDLFVKTEEVKTLIHKRIIDLVTKGILDPFDVRAQIRLRESIDRLRKNFINHAYFGPQDFPDFAKFLIKFKDAKDPVSRYLHNRFSPITRDLLANYDVNTVVPPDLVHTLINEFNDFLRDSRLYENGPFSHIKLSTETKEMLARKRTSLTTVVLNRLILEEVYPKHIAPNEYGEINETIVDIKLNLRQALEDLIRETQKAVANCPSVLTEGAEQVRAAWRHLEKTEKFVRIAQTHYGAVISEAVDDDYVIAPVRVRIPDPEQLLELDKVLLVEGPPGCGKTTLLKMLAINLLSANRKICYLPCFNIASDFRKMTLEEITTTFAEGSVVTEDEFKNSVLIIDGLDEAPFDLSPLISSSYEKFAHIVVSTRLAFATRLRSEFFRVELSQFTDEERELFFQNWFRSDPHLLNHAKELIDKYPDIDTHTRLPLIATILVVLLQNEIIPKTRAEIYGLRLDLLLSKWDKLRGVKRLYVDNPDAKRRFLRHLAYHLHSSEGRQRKIDLSDLRDVYEHSLGEWGYNVRFEDVLKDLVVGSGVLVEERPRTYSFGHLTFQEHLVGEYINQNYSVNKVALLLADDWWREPLNFYASIRGDITDLLDHVMEDFGHLAYAKQLTMMASYAPYTSPGAVHALRESLRDIAANRTSE